MSRANVRWIGFGGDIGDDLFLRSVSLRVVFAVGGGGASNRHPKNQPQKGDKENGKHAVSGVWARRKRERVQGDLHRVGVWVDIKAISCLGILSAIIVVDKGRSLPLRLRGFFRLPCVVRRCCGAKNHLGTKMRGRRRVGAGSLFCQEALWEEEVACALVGCSAGGGGFASRQVGEAERLSGRVYKELGVVWWSHFWERWASLYSCSWRVSNAALPRWRENQTAKRNATRNQLNVNKAKPRRAIWM